MSVINIFKKNKVPALQVMDNNVYRFKLKRISKDIKIDSSLSKEYSILRAIQDCKDVDLDNIFGQILIDKNNIPTYFRELSTEKLIPIFYIKQEYRVDLRHETIKDLSPIYIKYKHFYSANPYRWECAEPYNKNYKESHQVNLEEIKKYFQERRPNGDASVYLTKLNEYFEQAEEYYRLAGNKAKDEEKEIKQIVKSINNK